jgi:hypothetical protein
MRVFLLNTAFVILSFAFPEVGFGQTSGVQVMLEDDNDQVNPYLRELHFQQITQGKQYGFVYPEIRGHQFWIDPIYALGTLTFEGNTYHPVLINYDIYNNLVTKTILQNNLTRYIIVDKSRIDRFQIGEDSFINIRDSTHLLDPGIYLQAFHGPEVEFLVHRNKIIAGNSGRPGEPLRKFAIEESFILILNGEKHLVKNKKDVAKVFSDNPEILAFIKSSQLRFKQNGNMISDLTKVVDQL